MRRPSVPFETPARHAPTPRGGVQVLGAQAYDSARALPSYHRVCSRRWALGPAREHEPASSGSTTGHGG
ncbi:hypothetical protein [Archangium lansingense]|uniref:Uncharacterized protein n=1 Tax=Archangium lansingense TaxID=2995310 RepID=A0ABT3ZYY8_9BACT|nr:hypothetical protein [Archangium lansinium]MCY1074254.1 hypothetical protein [Archangium lansinium]